MKLDMTLDLVNPLSAADWVKQSRIKETLDKSNAIRLAELQQKRLEEEEDDLMNQASLYSSSDLKGLRVKHGDSDFETGQHVILTLADTDLLEMDDQGKLVGINEEDDVLENVNFADTDRRLERENRIKRNRQPIYSALDDAEFADGVIPGTRGPLLAQYDKEKKIAPKMLLGENGIVVAEKDATIVEKSHTNNFGSVQSLLSQIKTASDYLTAKETATFHKRNSKGKSGRKTRKRDTGEENEGDESDVKTKVQTHIESVVNVEDVEMNVDSIEDSNNNGGASADRGSRDAPRKTALDAVVDDEAKRLANYKLAVARAAETSKMNPLYNPEAKSASSVVLPGLGGDSAFDQSAYNERMRRELKQKADAAVGVKRAIALSAADWEDDDQDLVQALAKSRRLALQTRKNEEEEGGETKTTLSKEAYMEQQGAERVARAVAELQASRKGVVSRSLEEQAMDGEEEEGIDAEGRRADGTLVFNSTTEFTTRLQAGLNEKARLKTEAAMLDLERSAFTSASSSASLNRMVAEDVDDDDDDEEDIYGEKMGGGRDEHSGDSGEDSGDDDQMAFLHRQPLVAKGMAATLALLKGSGELKTTEALAGRAKDRRTVDPSANDFNVKLEYRDDTGRKLTQKEAFRQLSYRFHGYGPGQKKKEKRLKAIETQNKASTSRAGILDGNGGMMGSFTKAQEATGMAHITIQGGASNAAVSAANLATLMKSSKK